MLIKIWFYLKIIFLYLFQKPNFIYVDSSASMVMNKKLVKHLLDLFARPPIMVKFVFSGGSVDKTNWSKDSKVLPFFGDTPLRRYISPNSWVFHDMDPNQKNVFSTPYKKYIKYNSAFYVYIF